MSARFMHAYPAVVLAALVLSQSAVAQLGTVNGRTNVEQSATYISQIDQDLTIRRIAILPVSDNLDGIYSRPVENQLSQLIKNSHRWDFAESGIVGNLPSMIELEENPTEVQQAARSIDADALIGASINRGPNGLTIRLNLFLKKDGKILSQELLRNHPRFEIAEIREQVNELYRRLIARIPYEGLILSRQQNRVTVNLGKSDGLKKDQILTAVQIISLNRHPRFNFIVSSEKEILGRIKILKVDETLSFGTIIAEKERGAITRFAKVSGVEPVTYPDPVRLEEGAAPGDVTTRTDGSVAFGPEPSEWLPVHPPSFGQVGTRLGLGTYTSSANLTGVGALEAKSLLYPSLHLHGEMWLTPTWYTRAELLQGVISTPNPRSGSSPSTLNQSLSRYSFEFGYNFLLRGDFFGPKIYLSLGYSTYRMFVDDSQPRALTTVDFGGLLIGMGGSLPVTDDKLWYINGRLNFYPLTSLTDSAVSSGGSAKATINDFSIGGERKIAENVRATASLEFALYSATFSGAGSGVGSITTLSQNHLSVTGGLIYMF